MSSKMVSVIIPTYKRPDTLERAIKSVLGQDYKNIEIIIVDDNNPNDTFRNQTEDVMMKFKNIDNIKYVKHETNKNGSAARNTGFRNSSGEYIMFLDDDDEFLPKKIEKQLECMESRSIEWGACYTRYVRKKGEKIVMTCYENREGDLLKEELKRNLFVHAGSNLMIRRKVFEELNGFDESFLRNQDIEFLVRLLKRYKIAYVDTMGLVVNVHERNSKQSFEDLTIQYIEKFKGFIDELDDRNQKEVYDMLKLQVFRSKIFKLNTLFEALEMLMKREVKIGITARYMFHLFQRKVFKRSCGFVLRKE